MYIIWGQSRSSSLTSLYPQTYTHTVLLCECMCRFLDVYELHVDQLLTPTFCECAVVLLAQHRNIRTQNQQQTFRLLPIRNFCVIKWLTTNYAKRKVLVYSCVLLAHVADTSRKCLLTYLSQQKRFRQFLKNQYCTYIYVWSNYF